MLRNFKHIPLIVAASLVLGLQAWADHHESNHGTAHQEAGHVCSPEHHAQHATHHGQQTHASHAQMLPQKLKVRIQATEGSEVKGWALMEMRQNKLHIWGQVNGLTPGQHGFHIHEFGDCSAADGSSAGGHFGLSTQSHAAPGDKSAHIGDLGNITADATGTAKFDFELPLMAHHGLMSLVGRGVIVHAGEDDLKSQPAGNAGPRKACGVIGISKP